MARVGYYRAKINVQEPGVYKYTWEVNGEPRCVSTVVVKPRCDESMYVKYLDKYGKYRFILFNKYWSRTESTTSRGETVNISNFGEVSQLGQKLQEVYTLSVENVTPEELEVYADIYSSPNIYMKLNGEWKSVILDGTGGVNRRNRPYNNKFTITLIDKNVSTIIK